MHFCIRNRHFCIRKIHVWICNIHFCGRNCHIDRRVTDPNPSRISAPNKPVNGRSRPFVVMSFVFIGAEPIGHVNQIA